MNFQDHALESAIIGACLLESDALLRVRHLVDGDHFDKPGHRAAYELMGDMWSDGKQIDLLTVAWEAREVPSAAAAMDGNPAYFLTQCMAAVVNTHNLETHALLVREMYVRRLSRTIRATAGDTTGFEDPVKAMQQTQEAIQKALSISHTDDWRDMSQVMIGLQSHMSEVKGRDMLGMPTGFRDLDRLTSGLQGGQLVVIAARPAVGKSAFVGALALNAARAGHNVGIISLEMPEKQIGARMAAMYSDAEFWRIYRNNFDHSEEEALIYRKLSDMASLPIFISDKTNVTAGAIRSKAMKLKKRKGKLGAIIIDYLQLIESEGKASDTREREVAKLTRALKTMAMDMDIPIVLLCQLNRESAKLPSKVPRMDQIRESGAIEQDADMVWLLHSQWKSGELHDEAGNSTEFQRTLIVAKNRNGEDSTLTLGCDMARMAFFDLPDAMDFTAPDRANTPGIQGARAAMAEEETPF